MVSLRKLTSTVIDLEVLEEMMVILVKAASLIIQLLGFLCDYISVSKVTNLLVIQKLWKRGSAHLQPSGVSYSLLFFQVWC